MGVNRVDTASGEVIMDISDSTVTPETLAEGEKAYNAQGEQIVGAAKLGDSTKEIVWIDMTLNIATMAVIYISHTYQEMVELIGQEKILKCRVDIGIGSCFCDVIVHNKAARGIVAQLMVQYDFGDGVKLYYFSIVVTENGAFVNPFIINTTSMLG